MSQNLNQLLDLTYFAPNFFKILDKSGTLIPFKFNKAQLYIHSKLEEQKAKTGKVRALILKARQQGCSTYVQARFTHKILTRAGTKAFILTHEAEATANLFAMTKRYIEHLPEGMAPKPETSSANKLIFKSLNSGYAIGTAGNKGTGRSQTLQLFHGSEYGFWPHADEHSKGVLQAVAGLPDTEIILESTANGMGNSFHSAYTAAESGESEFIAIFTPWYWQEEYTVSMPGFAPSESEQKIYDLYSHDGLTWEHMAWRRLKIANFSGDELQKLEQFQQEFPFTATEAFRNPVADRFINANVVMKARKNQVQSESPLIIGVDPAIGDTDKCAIIRRRGRLAFGIETYQNHNTMQIAGIIVKIIERERPHSIYIDIVGIGAGVVDRLLELGHDCVHAVDVRKRANEVNRFINRRAELWNEMREWLLSDLPVQIPDRDDMHRDLTSLGYKTTSDGKLQIESKEDLKKRGMPSPDLADALAYTFGGGANVQGGNTWERPATHYRQPMLA